MDAIDIFSLVSSITSIVLGITAIVLSIVFYKMSERMSRENEKISNRVESNVSKLEALFNKLYSGTFDIMKETVTDMRKHVYKSEKGSVNGEDNELILQATISELSGQMKELKSHKIDEKQVKELVNDILTKSKQVESDIKNDKIRLEIIKFLKTNGPATYRRIQKHLEQLGLDEGLFKELQKMANEGIVVDLFEPHEDGFAIGMDTDIYLR
jgi:hypothetical protein